MVVALPLMFQVVPVRVVRLPPELMFTALPLLSAQAPAVVMLPPELTFTVPERFAFLKLALPVTFTVPPAFTLARPLKVLLAPDRFSMPLLVASVVKLELPDSVRLLPPVEMVRPLPVVASPKMLSVPAPDFVKAKLPLSEAMVMFAVVGFTVAAPVSVVAPKARLLPLPPVALSVKAPSEEAPSVSTVLAGFTLIVLLADNVNPRSIETFPPVYWSVPPERMRPVAPAVVKLPRLLADPALARLETDSVPLDMVVLPV